MAYFGVPDYAKTSSSFLFVRLGHLITEANQLARADNIRRAEFNALSSDGGHLNDLGKRMAAKAFLHTMAKALGGYKTLAQDQALKSSGAASGPGTGDSNR